MTLNELITKLETLRDKDPGNGDLRVCPDNGESYLWEDRMLDVGAVDILDAEGHDGYTLTKIVLIQSKDER